MRRVKPGLKGKVLCDFDKPKVPSLLRLWELLRIGGYNPRWLRLDRTRRGWHAVIPLRLPKAETIALQAILGSDPRREAFNLRRLKNGVYLNQLFEPEETK